MSLVRVTPDWYESRDGRYCVLRVGSKWALAAFNGQRWVSESFRSKREAAAEVARRLTQERTNA